MNKKAYKKWRKEVEEFGKQFEPKPIPWWKNVAIFLAAWGLWALMWLGIFWAIGDALKGIKN